MGKENQGSAGLCSSLNILSLSGAQSLLRPRPFSTLLALVWLFALLATGSQAQAFLLPTGANSFPKMKTSARGFVSYSQLQEFENLAKSDTFWRSRADLNELELKGEYYISPRSEVEYELEFEHGGTGTSLEYDPLEESGEIETEVESGGEANVSELYYKFNLGNMTWIKAGKIPVNISLANIEESYFLYPSVSASSAEAFMLPPDWREIGVEIQKMWGPWNARLSLLTGLNSEYFRSNTWVGGGYQSRFEGKNADHLAIHGSWQYGEMALGDGFGFAFYYGDTAANRYLRGHLKRSADLGLYSLMGSWHFGRLGVRGQVIAGTLGHSDLITNANTNIGTLNAGVFAPVGHKALLEMAELSYNWWHSEKQDFISFVSYQHVNTMQAVEGDVFKNARFNQLLTSLGVSWRFDSTFFLKAEATQISNALAGLPDTHQYQLAFGFDLNGFNN